VARDSGAHARQKRLNRFRQQVRQSKPESSNAARRAVYQELLSRFGSVILRRHVERITAVLDLAEEQAHRDGE
jgi:hypothetical protein